MPEAIGREPTVARDRGQVVGEVGCNVDGHLVFELAASANLDAQTKSLSSAMHGLRP